MRTIKFRAYHEATQRMFEVEYINFHFRLLRGSKVGPYLSFDDVIQMQFTGAPDKHGTDIYEGDIIKYGDTVGTIKWSVDDTKFYVSAHAQNTEFNNGIWNLSIGRDSHLIEVTGNIYENPELLQLEV